MVPVEERTRGCVAAVPTETVPKATLDALTPKTAVAASSSTANVCDTPPALAVNIAACVDVTADASAVNSALLAPAGTVTEAGTTTALSLLVKLIARPPLAAAAFRVTVQVSAALPRMDPLTQLNSVSMGTPVPLNVTEVEVPLDALLAIVSWPLADPDAVGLNWTVTVTLALAPTVIGRDPFPLIANGCPVRFNSEISIVADPEFVSVTTLLTVLPTATCPKSTVLADTLRVPATEPFVTNDPEHPLSAKPHVKDSSQMKLNFKGRIFPPNGPKVFIGARARFIAKTN